MTQRTFGGPVSRAQEPHQRVREWPAKKDSQPRGAKAEKQRAAIQNAVIIAVYRTVCSQAGSGKVRED